MNERSPTSSPAIAKAFLPIMRIAGDCPFEGSQRTRFVIHVTAQAAQSKPRLLIARLDVHRCTKLIESALAILARAIARKNLCQKIVRNRRSLPVWLELNRYAELLFSPVQIAGLSERHGQIDMRVGQAWIESDGLLKGLACLVELSEAIQCCPERVIGRGRVRAQFQRPRKLLNRFRSPSFEGVGLPQQEMNAGIAGLRLERVLKQMRGLLIRTGCEELPCLNKLRTLSYQNGGTENRKERDATNREGLQGPLCNAPKIQASLLQSAGSRRSIQTRNTRLRSSPG